jgi:hypothetical protein
MLTKPDETGERPDIPVAAIDVEPIVGRRQRAFRLSDMTAEQREHFLKAKAPEHSKQFNHECD